LLPSQSVDSRPGAYHDARSGAFVGFDGNSRAAAPSAPTAAPQHDAMVGGVPYRLQVIPQVRDSLIEQGRRRFGSDYPERIPGAEDFLPLAGAKRLVVTFLAAAVEWRFSGDVYSKEQEQRVRQLLLSDSGVCRELSPFVERRGSIEKASYGRILEGESVETVLAKLGPPYVSRPVGRTGFALRYSVHDDDRTVQVDLHFDQQQKLVKKREAT
jgi:hypothetical protein